MCSKIFGISALKFKLKYYDGTSTIGVDMD